MLDAGTINRLCLEVPRGKRRWPLWEAGALASITPFLSGQDCGSTFYVGKGQPSQGRDTGSSPVRAASPVYF